MDNLQIFASALKPTLQDACRDCCPLTKCQKSQPPIHSWLHLWVFNLLLCYCCFHLHVPSICSPTSSSEASWRLDQSSIVLLPWQGWVDNIFQKTLSISWMKPTNPHPATPLPTVHKFDELLRFFPDGRFTISIATLVHLLGNWMTSSPLHWPIRGE